MKIAVEGCAHGELEKIYDCVETLQEREGIKIDLLICCGDFQAVRNKTDLCAMAVPEKYHNMCSFYKYYSGERKAPILTIFIGGNHEASNYLQELPYGGWVAPNIYYLGRAGVIQIGDLRIGGGPENNIGKTKVMLNVHVLPTSISVGNSCLEVVHEYVYHGQPVHLGLSGIFKGRDYLQGFWECPPYTQNSLRSVYHVRSFDMFRLRQLKDKVHVMLSHDWPRGITEYGNKEQLLRFKPFLREDIEANQLGSVPAEKLLHLLKPDYWFSAHLHCQFVALVKHDDGNETKFLALDKCLPKRRHLQILDVPSEFDGDKTLKYDAEWLAVLKSTNHLLSVKNIDCHMPGPGGNERYDFTPTKDEKEAVVNSMKDMTIKEENFVRTAPIFNSKGPKIAPSEPLLNPQTANLCDLLGIDDPIQVLVARAGRTLKAPGNYEPVQSEKSESSAIIEVTPSKSVIKQKCSKMSLPAPVTPCEDDRDKVSQKVCSPNNVSLTDSFNTTDECVTPLSATKKTFKRRNVSIYNTPDQDSESTASTLLDPESSPSKLPHKLSFL